MFWFAYLLADVGAWQRATFRPKRAAVGQAELIDANARFLRNRLRTEHVSELIVEPLKRRLAHKWQIGVDDALGKGLAQESKKHPQAVNALEASLKKLQNGERITHLRLAKQVAEINQLL